VGRLSTAARRVGIRQHLEVDVAATVDALDVTLGTTTPVMVRGWVGAPAGLDPSEATAILVCFPGGGCTTGYFDLAVSGRDDYSMANELVRRGFVVAAFDHIGIGTSDPIDDLFPVTPTVAAAVNHTVASFTLEGLRSGSLSPGMPALADTVAIGVGHSMGGMLVAVQQARHRTFDAIAVLGHGGDGLAHHLTDGERALVGRPLTEIEPQLVELSRRRFANPPRERRRAEPESFFASDVPRTVKAAFNRQRTRLLSTCGLTSMVPSASDGEKAAIATPVFLAFGDADLTHDYAGCLARYTSATDVTLFVLRGSGHCHNQASTRLLLWDRLARWARALDPGAA
jgi:pimeloyl-ACP methyl ester carboxylesterase